MGICHKMMLLQSFEAQVKAAEQKKTFEDIEVEGELFYRIFSTVHIVKSSHCAQSQNPLIQHCICYGYWPYKQRVINYHPKYLCYPSLCILTPLPVDGQAVH